MKKLISTLALIFTCYSLIFAIDFKGIVKDEITQQPISNALVRVFKGNDLIASAKTSVDGSFNIPLLMGADYKVYVDKDLYEQLRISITTNFSATITQLPLLELMLEKVKLKAENTIVSVNLVGKIYHLQIGGLEGEKIILKNNLTGAISSASSQANGNYSLPLQPNANYTITIQSKGIYPEYEYSPIYLNTTGIASSMQIVRNFENRGIVVKEVAKSSDEPISTLISKDDKVTKAEITKIDKSKEIDQSITSNKQPKSKTTDSVEKKKEKMVAKNVVVKFYDDENKKESKTSATTNNNTNTTKINDSVKKEIKTNTENIDKNNKAEQFKKDSVKVVLHQKIEKEKSVKSPTITIEEKTIITKTPKTTINQEEQHKQIDVKTPIKTEKSDEKIAEEKRIDSMIGTGPRFMHKELTGSEKTKNTINDSSSTKITRKSLLPVLIEEDRTPVIDDKIYYGEGKASLDEEAKQYLANLSEKLKTDQSLKLELAINCDQKDEASVADYICKLRIKRIVDFMVNVLKVNFQQLVIRSVGVNEPVNNCKKDSLNCTELDHQMNRRTEVKYLY